MLVYGDYFIDIYYLKLIKTYILNMEKKILESQLYLNSKKKGGGGRDKLEVLD